MWSLWSHRHFSAVPKPGCGLRLAVLLVQAMLSCFWLWPPLQLPAGREPWPWLLPRAEVGDPLPLSPWVCHSVPSPHSASAQTCAPALCLEDLRWFYTKLITIHTSSKYLKCFLSKYQLGTTGDCAIQMQVVRSSLKCCNKLHQNHFLFKGPLFSSFFLDILLPGHLAKLVLHVAPGLSKGPIYLQSNVIP